MLLRKAELITVKREYTEETAPPWLFVFVFLRKLEFVSATVAFCSLSAPPDIAELPSNVQLSTSTDESLLMSNAPATALELLAKSPPTTCMLEFEIEIAPDAALTSLGLSSTCMTELSVLSTTMLLMKGDICHIWIWICFSFEGGICLGLQWSWANVCFLTAWSVLNLMTFDQIGACPSNEFPGLRVDKRHASS